MFLVFLSLAAAIKDLERQQGQLKGALETLTEELATARGAHADMLKKGKVEIADMESRKMLMDLIKHPYITSVVID